MFRTPFGTPVGTGGDLPSQRMRGGGAQYRCSAATFSKTLHVGAALGLVVKQVNLRYRTPRVNLVLRNGRLGVTCVPVFLAVHRIEEVGS
jgi:hypothetical protein